MNDNLVQQYDKAIIEPQDRHELKAALNQSETLHQRGVVSICLFENGAPEVVLNELGRVREESFRSFGFGAGLSCDRDEFDYTYDHLIIWNEEKRDIVGAYRVRVNRTFEQLEKSSLSKTYQFDPDLMNMVGSAVELGRSVVALPYMKTRAFDDLFRGISLYLYRHSCRYFIGPLSFDEKLKEEALRYLQKIMSTKELFDKRIHPINPNANWQPKDTTQEDLDRPMNERVSMLKSYNRELEIRYPALLFHYLNVTSRCFILPYHHDEVFHSIDALMIHDVYFAYESYIKRYAPGGMSLRKIYD